MSEQRTIPFSSYPIPAGSRIDHRTPDIANHSVVPTAGLGPSVLPQIQRFTTSFTVFEFGTNRISVNVARPITFNWYNRIWLLLPQNKKQWMNERRKILVARTLLSAALNHCFEASRGLKHGRLTGTTRATQLVKTFISCATWLMISTDLSGNVSRRPMNNEVVVLCRSACSSHFI